MRLASQASIRSGQMGLLVEYILMGLEFHPMGNVESLTDSRHVMCA